MFGFGSGKSKHTLKLVIGVVLVILFIGIGKFFISNGDSKLTGQVITAETSQDIQGNQNQDPSLANEKYDPINIIEEEPEENPLEYEYYDYGGQCAYDIKKAEDDVDDILAYIDANGEKYKTLKDEYNRKLEELAEQYERQIEIAGEKVEQDRLDLEKAQEELQQVQEVCSF